MRARLARLNLARDREAACARTLEPAPASREERQPFAPAVPRNTRAYVRFLQRYASTRKEYTAAVLTWSPVRALSQHLLRGSASRRPDRRAASRDELKGYSRSQPK